MKAKQLPSEEEKNVIDVSFDDVSKLELDNEDELAKILKEVGDDPDDVHYTMNVYRVPPNGGLLWLYECDPTEPQKAKLRDEYGGGKFELRITRNNRIFRRPKVQIESPKLSGRVQQINNNKSNADIAALIERSEARLLDTVAKMITAQQPAPQPNPMDQMAAMVALMTQIKQFTQSEPVVRDDPYDNIKKVLELKKLFGGSSEGETNNSDVLMAAIEHIGGPLSKLTQRGNETLHTNLQKKSKPQSTGSDHMLSFKMGISSLVSAAAKNDDPAPYVDIILTRMEADQIKTFLTDEGAMDLLVNVNAKVKDHPLWFGELKTLILERLGDGKADNPEDDTKP